MTARLLAYLLCLELEAGVDVRAGSFWLVFRLLETVGELDGLPRASDFTAATLPPLVSSGFEIDDLVLRVGLPLLPFVAGANSIGSGFVLPDLRRPSTTKEVGVWVVALFHGGELSIFLFFVGGFGVSSDAAASSPFLSDSTESVGPGVVSLGSVAEKDESVVRAGLYVLRRTKMTLNLPGVAGSSGRLRVLFRIQEPRTDRPRLSFQLLSKIN